MKSGSSRYLIGEGIKSAWANRLMSLASVGVLVACMVIIGLALLISENVSRALGKLEEQNVAMVYMKDYSWALYSDEVEKVAEGGDENGITPEMYVIHDENEAKELCEKIGKLDNVEAVEYISGEQGLESIKSEMIEGQEQFFDFLNEEHGNPLPSSAKVTMKDMAHFEETVNQIKALDGVDNIKAQDDLAERISAVKKGIIIAGIWIISILLVISLVVVSNTIRITMYNRKLEISIMKAVGATDAFVRIPFIVEGVLIGLISAVIAEGLLYFCYRVATETIAETLGTADIVRYSEMALYLLGVFAIIGVLAGAIGSFIMIGKYLRREGSEFSAI